ncbi:MAG: hypothetical protein K1W26_14135 [Acetatifactor sp.]
MNRTRLKYYLRALGVGIVVTALLMGYSQKGQARMTDEEILQRAAELGMTHPEGVLSELATVTPEPSRTLSEIQPETSPTPSPETQSTPEPEDQPVSGNAANSTAASGTEPADSTAQPTDDSITQPAASPTAEPAVVSTASPAPTPAAKPSPTPTAKPTPAPTAEPAGETVTLVINRGESSVTVSKNLQALGLVEDYKTYDRFLCDNGYDHSISTGTYEIPVDATEEEIARIITKKR